MASRKKVEDFRKIYLFLYNLFQFVGYLYTLIILSIEYSKDGPGTFNKSFQSLGTALKFCQMLQFLEILHPMLGYTSGNWVMPLLQVSGRALVIFGLIQREPRTHSMPAVFYLMYVYALVEVVRYPYYMLKIYNVDVGIVTWLRYTIWIFLYPLGFLCEGVIILRSIPYAEETGMFSVFLPNAWNFSFYFPTLMRCYLLIGLFPFLYFMMTYMYNQRKKILNRNCHAYEQ